MNFDIRVDMSTHLMCFQEDNIIYFVTLFNLSIL